MAITKTEEEIIQLVRQKALAYLRLPNVTSVGVGYKKIGGEETKKLSVQFTVGKKLELEKLEKENFTPLPTSISTDDGIEIPVDVLQRSYKPSHRIVDDPTTRRLAAADLLPREIRRSRLEVMMPGISVSNIRIASGTFGAIVYDVLNGTPYILSNWHVLNGPQGSIGNQIIQPGRTDPGNIFSNVVGTLVRSHLGVAGDCAIASITGRRIDERILEMNVTPRRIAIANNGDKVVKSGRTTGVTFGIVTRTGVTTNINYGGSVGIQQIGGFEIRPNPAKLPPDGEISMDGDSGSLYMLDTNGAEKDIAVGLLFAGETDPNPTEEHALACNIHSVLEKLQITFINPNAPQSTRSTRRNRA